jgi:hypothetical protein
MKKLLLPFALLFISADLLAWEIPLDNCHTYEGKGVVYRTETWLGNERVNERRPDDAYRSAFSLTFRCSSTLFKGYGEKIDIDIWYANPNTQEAISCYAKTYRRGSVVQATPTVYSGKNQMGKMTINHTALPANASEPETISVFCKIPQVDYSIGITQGAIGHFTPAYGKENAAFISYIRIY